MAERHGAPPPSLMSDEDSWAGVCNASVALYTAALSCVDQDRCEGKLVGLRLMHCLEFQLQVYVHAPLQICNRLCNASVQKESHDWCMPVPTLPVAAKEMCFDHDTVVSYKRFSTSPDNYNAITTGQRGIPQNESPAFVTV